VYGGSPDFGAFVVDGNNDGNGNPFLSIAGANSGTSFITSESGDPSVNLPIDAVSSGEILNEVGAAANKQTFYTAFGVDPAPVTSRTISCPTNGWVVAMAQGEIELDHDTGTFTWCRFGLSLSSTTIPDGQDFGPQMPPGAASGIYLVPTSPTTIFPVSAGDVTVYLLGEANAAGTIGVWESEMTLLFVPTNYGDIAASVATAKTSSDQVNDGGVASPMSASDLAAERATSLQANQARIDAELAAMRAELDALKAQLANANGTE
jgi:hypothetical protein